MMNRGSARVAAVASTAIVVMALTACSTSEASSGVKNDSGCDVQPESRGSEPLTGEPSGEITFQTTNLKKDFSGFFEPLIAEFEEQNPEVTVTWIDDPGDQDFESRTLAQARACDLPDVVNLNITAVTGLNEADQLIDFSAKAPDVGSVYVESVWDSIAFDEGAQHPALPWYWSPSVLTYNKELLEKAGLDPENPPTTSEEFFDVAQTIGEEADGEFYALNGNVAWDFLTDWQAAGVEMMNDDHTEFTFADDPQAIAYVQGLADAYAAGAIAPDSVAGSPDPTEAYSAGQVVFGTRNASFLRYLRDNAPSIYPVTGVASAPQSTGKTPFVGQYIAVPNTTENPEAAVAFAAFLTNDANQLAWAKDPGVVVFPSSTEALKDPFFSATADGDPLSQARAVAAEDALDAAFSPAMIHFGAAVTAETTKQLQLATIGEISPEEALQAAQDAGNQQLASK
ncbi:extracellular solute-binding protein [Microbacterium sp. MYb62]|uniref:extracellular solute-binding protein n=1 Tax=Microbacterium sp. MYb62 TaxID=1848690 RepID=UPI0015E39743|nr:extracellular solute-binding protein [Microbacterium sp. MYb62]